VRRITLALLLVAVFLPATALARIHHLCREDMLARSACCCAPKRTVEHRPAWPNQGATMQRECCALAKAGSVLPPLAEQTVPQPPAAPIAIAVLLPEPPVVVRAVRLTVAPRAQAPPHHGSLFAQHCALLV
jgi:hypothetical protein